MTTPCEKLLAEIEERLTNARHLCGTCGSCVGIYSGHEGTNSFEPLDGDDIEKIVKMVKVAREALRKNDQFYKCMHEMEDPQYCGEYMEIADSGTSEALAELDRLAGEERSTAPMRP